MCLFANGVQSVKTSSSRRQTCPNQSNYQTKIARRKNVFGKSVCESARIQSKFLWIKFGLVFLDKWTIDGWNVQRWYRMRWYISSTASIFSSPASSAASATDKKWTNFTAAKFELPTNQIKSARRHTHTFGEREKSTQIFAYLFIHF